MPIQDQLDPSTTFFSTLNFGAKTSDKPAVITSTPMSTSAPSPRTPNASSSGAATPSSAACTQNDRGIHDMDQGEKDRNGNVMTATKEPCEQCGGKIVWATKRQWSIVCQRCGEPQ